MTPEPRHVLDANVFIHGAEQALRNEFSQPMTVPLVQDELESTAASRRFLVDEIDVYTPSAEYVETVQDMADERGESLSDADVQIVALALERDAVIVSDDYGVQNVAAALDVAYTGFRKEPIEDEISWIWKCRNCGATVDTEQSSCDRCGGTMKRVPEQKQRTE